MEENERLEIRAEWNEAFESGTVMEATPEQLLRFLRYACTGDIKNESVHPREIVRGITINHIQMARVIKQLEQTIKQLNTQNARTERWVVILALVSLIATAIGIFK